MVLETITIKGKFTIEELKGITQPLEYCKLRVQNVPNSIAVPEIIRSYDKRKDKGFKEIVDEMAKGMDEIIKKTKEKLL